MYETIRPKIVHTAVKYLVEQELYKDEGIVISHDWLKEYSNEKENYIIDDEDQCSCKATSFFTNGATVTFGVINCKSMKKRLFLLVTCLILLVSRANAQSPEALLAYAGELTIDVAAGTQRGTRAFTASDGSSFRATSVGTSFSRGPGLVGFTATLRVIDGSGRFVGITGELLGEGTANQITRTTTVTFVGTLTYR